MIEYFAEITTKIGDCECDICKSIIYTGETFYKRLSDYKYYCCNCFDSKYNDFDNWEKFDIIGVEE